MAFGERRGMAFGCRSMVYSTAAAAANTHARLGRTLNVLEAKDDVCSASIEILG